jgi:hypothetical protein
MKDPAMSETRLVVEYNLARSAAFVAIAAILYTQAGMLPSWARPVAIATFVTAGFFGLRLSRHSKNSENSITSAAYRIQLIFQIINTTFLFLVFLFFALAARTSAAWTWFATMTIALIASLVWSAVRHHRLKIKS